MVKSVHDDHHEFIQSQTAEDCRSIAHQVITLRWWLKRAGNALVPHCYGSGAGPLRGQLPFTFPARRAAMDSQQLTAAVKKLNDQIVDLNQRLADSNTSGANLTSRVVHNEGQVTQLSAGVASHETWLQGLTT